jgi:hypothetical protein
MPVLPALLLVLAVAPPLPPAPRSPAASATPAAQVLLVHGAVQLANGTKPVRVTRGTLLDRTDVVNVSEGAWVALVLLNNGHVVRLDDELNIAVEKLALFKAGPVKEDAQAQLDRLLTRREKEGLGSERLIGWHQGLSGANAMPPEAEKKKERSNDGPPLGGLGLQGVGRGGGGRGEGYGAANRGLQQKPSPAPQKVAELPPPPASPAPPPAPAPAPGPSEESAKRSPERRRLEPPGRPPADEEATVPGGALPRQPAPKPALAVDGSLEQCVAAAAKTAGAEVLVALGPMVHVRFRLSGDEVQVSTAGALPPHACLAAWAETNRSRLTDTWVTLQVPLQ